jgi:hypothetical protein
MERGWNAFRCRPTAPAGGTWGVSGLRTRLDELDYWTEADTWTGAGWTADRDGARPGLGPVLREVMRDDYAGADDEAYDDALDAVLDAMSTAEAFSFQKALRQIQSGAGRVLADPLVGQFARTALPVGAGALGTLIGGPAGTALGSRLGTLAAGALAPAGQLPNAPAGRPPNAPAGQPPNAPAGRPPAAPSGTAPMPQVAGGSAAAAQAAVLTQQPDVLKALVALAMGRHGAQQVGGMPVAAVMNMLSSVFGQAAADADELAYLDGDSGDAEEAYAEPAIGTGRSLYTALMDIENEEFVS